MHEKIQHDKGNLYLYKAQEIPSTSRPTLFERWLKIVRKILLDKMVVVYLYHEILKHKMKWL